MLVTLILLQLTKTSQGSIILQYIYGDTKCFLDISQYVILDGVFFYLVGFCIFLIAIYFIKFLSVFNQIQHIFSVFISIGSEIFSYSAIFLLIFLSFAMIFNIIFGKDIYDFSTFSGSITKMINRQFSM